MGAALFGSSLLAVSGDVSARVCWQGCGAVCWQGLGAVWGYLGVRGVPYTGC